MDAYEATRIVFSRIQSLDPENAAKIMGLLLIQDHGEKEMIRLAFGPETLLHSVILKARKELSLLPSTPSTPSSPSPYLSRQNSSSRLLGVTLPTTYTIPSPSSSPSTSWVSSSPSPFSRNGLTDSLQNQNQLSDVANIVSSSTSSSATSVYSDLIDESQLQDQLSFLNDSNSTTIPLSHKTNELFYPELGDLRSTSVGSESVLLPYSTSNWGDGNRCSLGADLFEAIGSGFGWKPCLYFARGYCKNGASCRFLHGLPDSPETTAKMEMMEQYQELLKKSHQNQRLNSSSQFLSSSFPFSSASGKCMNFLLQQQHSDAQRAAAALMFGDESHKFGRTRLEKYEFAGTGGMINPGSRQIYLTFPADSTFREEDVSNYFSIYGPVQDVRIPYQQKRMFGFVTFVYAETVKLILAKGNPHFVCDARVLVKPYKEKGKVPDKYRKQQQQIERGDFSTCTTPTSVDSRDSYDIQLGARLFYNAQELLIKKKLEEQAELQHAIELQGRRFTNLQLPDHLKKRSVSIPSEDQTQNLETTLRQDKCLGQTLDIEQSAAAFNVEKESAVSINAAGENSNTTESQFQESVEHNLPDSPFASPTKLQLEDPSSLLFSASSATSVGSSLPEKNNMSSSSPLFSTTSTLDMSSFKPCFFQIPRFSSGHGAIGM